MDAIQLIEFSISELPICQLEDVNELLKPILSRILAGVSKLSVDLKEPKNTLPALDLALTILSEFKDDSLKQENEFNELTQNVELFNEFFSKLCSHIISDEIENANDGVDEIEHGQVNQIQVNDEYLVTFEKSCVII